MKWLEFLRAEKGYLKELIKPAIEFKQLIIASLFAGFFLSLFSGMGVGMIIPFLQSIQGEKVGFISFLGRFGITFASRSTELIFILVVMLIATTLQNGMTFIADWIGILFNERVTIKLRNQILTRLYTSEYLFFLWHKPGKLANIFVQQVQGFGAAVFNFLRFVTTLGVLLIYVALLVVISPLWTAVSLAVLLSLSYFTHRLSKSIHYYNSVAVDKDEKITTLLLDDLRGIKQIKCYTMADVRQNEYGQLFIERLKASLAHNLRIFSILPGTEIIVLFLVIFGMTTAILIDSKLFFSTLPFIVAFLVILMRLKWVFQNISQFYVNMVRYKQNVFNVLDLQNSLKSADSARTIPFQDIKKEIRFEKVSFGYDSKRPVVSNFSLTIQKGETVALVGRSGSGKTTLAYMLLGLIQPLEGKIEIDGVDLTEFDRQSYYSRIGLVSQETFLFNESLYWNIAQGKIDRFSLKDVRRAAGLANIDEFISSLDRDYETLLGDKGMDLSGGERQRVGIAQALINNPELLILDEPTSALDNYNEQKIMDTIRTACRDRTVLIITHRLSAVMGADKIVVMKNGQIFGSGTHEELLNSCEDYQHLYKEQLVEGRQA